MNVLRAYNPYMVPLNPSENPDGPLRTLKPNVRSQEKRWWKGYGARRLSHLVEPGFEGLRRAGAGPCQRDVSYRPYV